MSTLKDKLYKQKGHRHYTLKLTQTAPVQRNTFDENEHVQANKGSKSESKESIERKAERQK